MQTLADLLERFGPWALVLIVGLYMIVNGRVVFTYPRRSRRRSVRASRAEPSQRL